MKSLLSAIFCIPLTAAPLVAAQSVPSLDDSKAVDKFVDEAKWVLIVGGKEVGEVEFQSNHTMPKGKSVKLGSKQYSYWSVAPHPIEAKKYVLRISAKKSSGWYSFQWNSSKRAWVSRDWPKHQIKLK